MQKQAGFIQNFIIPGIILIGVVIAGIAMLASNSGGTDTSNEKASMLANSVVGMGLTVSGALQRAEADGAGTDTGPVTNSGILVSGKYLTAVPSLPQGLSGYGDVISYDKGTTWAVVDGNGGQVGTTANDDVILVALGDDATAGLVCDRINNKIAGSASNNDKARASFADGAVTSNTGVTGVTEGCGRRDNDVYTYYKVVNAK